MSKKKSVYSWILLVLVSIMAFLSLLGSILLMFSVSAFLIFSNSPELQEIQQELAFEYLVPKLIINLFLSIGLLVFFVMFILKLYNVKPDLIKWTHITFGAYLVSDVLTQPLATLDSFFDFTALIDLFFFIRIGIVAVLWVTFVMHLKKARREKTMDFS